MVSAIQLFFIRLLEVPLQLWEPSGLQLIDPLDWMPPFFCLRWSCLHGYSILRLFHLFGSLFMPISGKGQGWASKVVVIWSCWGECIWWLRGLVVKVGQKIASLRIFFKVLSFIIVLATESQGVENNAEILVQFLLMNVYKKYKASTRGSGERAIFE